MRSGELDRDSLAAVATRSGSVGEALALLYAEYAARRGARVGADKTPYHVLHLGLLAEHLPGSRFVHLLRDGRDVAPSLATMPFGPDRLGGAALYWQRHVTAGREAGVQLPGRYLEIRYEDLVAEPAGTLAVVADFLEVGFDPAMLDYGGHADRLLGPLRQSDHLQGIRKPPLATRDWRSALSPRNLALVEVLVGDCLAKTGYPLSEHPVPLAVRVEALSERARARAHASTTRIRAAVARRRLGMASGRKG